MFFLSNNDKVCYLTNFLILPLSFILFLMATLFRGFFCISFSSDEFISFNLACFCFYNKISLFFFIHFIFDMHSFLFHQIFFFNQKFLCASLFHKAFLFQQKYHYIHLLDSHYANSLLFQFLIFRFLFSFF